MVVEVEAQLDGPLADALGREIRRSPLAGMTQHALDESQGR